MTLPVTWIILNDIHDAQMFVRAPQRKFERLGPFEYYDDAEFVDRFRFTKEEMRLVVLRLNIPVNNFSVISGRSHRFLGN